MPIADAAFRTVSVAKPRTRFAHSCDQPPYSSLERYFCRRRLARQKGPEGDVSAQRPEIGDHHTREMAAKTAFLLASYQLRLGTRARTWDPLMNQGP